MRCSFHHQVRKFAIVGEEEQAFAGIVEASDGIHTRADAVQQIHHCRPLFRIAQGGDVILGLVHQQVNVALGFTQKFSIYADVVVLKVGFAAEFGDDLSR